MSDTKTSALAALTGLAANDLFMVVDVSDTSMAASGTNTKITVANVFTSPTFVTPTLGAALATSINGLTLTSSTGTLSITNGKTFAVTHSLTLSGTDSTVMTFPTTSATIARTDAANTFTGTQTMTTPSFTTGFTIGGAATSRKIMVGNGTNFVPSTETYAAPGTSGNLLTSDGTNWTSAAAAGGGLTVGTTAIASGTATRLLYETAGNVVGEVAGSSSDANGTLVLATSVRSSGVLPYLNIRTPADTAQTVDTEFPGIVFGGNSSFATVTRTGADGTTYALQREYIFVAPTYAFAGATTITKAATLHVTNPPIAGSNATLTARYAMLVTGAASAGLPAFRVEAGSGTSSTTINDNGTVVIDSDSGTGTTPLSIKYNGGAVVISMSYLGVVTGTSYVSNASTGGLNFAGDAGIFRVSAGVVEINNNSSGSLGLLLAGRVVTAKTGDFTVTTAGKSTFFTNTGAAGAVNFTLPTAAVGLIYSFYRDANQTVQITAGASTTIRVGATVTAAAGNVTLDAVGSRIEIVAISTTSWVGNLTGTATFT